MKAAPSTGGGGQPAPPKRSEEKKAPPGAENWQPNEPDECSTFQWSVPLSVPERNLAAVRTTVSAEKPARILANFPVLLRRPRHRTSECSNKGNVEMVSRSHLHTYPIFSYSSGDTDTEQVTAGHKRHVETVFSKRLRGLTQACIHCRTNQDTDCGSISGSISQNNPNPVLLRRNTDTGQGTARRGAREEKKKCEQRGKKVYLWWRKPRESEHTAPSRTGKRP